jgi:hypothetical protein
MALVLDEEGVDRPEAVLTAERQRRSPLMIP